MDNYCHHYMNNGFKKADAAKAAGYSKKSAKAAATYLMKNPKVLKRIEELKEKTGMTSLVNYEDKIKKLWHIAELAAPEEATSVEEMDPKSAIAAITELNKMQGHHAAEKYIVANPQDDEEVEKMHDKMEALKDYQKEY